jgi:glutamine amidotransferase-like uncharacterized protein
MKPTIALFVNDPKCSVQSSNGILKSLENHYHFKLFSKNKLEDNFFDDVDLIAVPGGFGDASSYKNLFKYNAKTVRKFVRQGGKYLGICMGAYWAGKHYLNILDGIDTVQYIKRPRTDTRRPHAKAIDIVWNEEHKKMFFYDGCAIVGNTKNCNIVSTYANGDAMALIKDNIGLIGGHPESQKFWYEDYTWMEKHWHDGEHNILLLKFVNKLMKDKNGNTT